MKKYAQIQARTVVNIIVAEDKAEAEAAVGSSLIEIGESDLVKIGDVHIAETGQFVDPSSMIDPDEVPVIDPNVAE